jgi:prepilin-type N-terminal cleavage/methylation domain-containing protein
MSSHRFHRSSGFSMIELLVTVVLAGIVFAAMVPMFVNANQKNVADTFRTVCNNLAQDKIEKVRQLPYDSIVALTNADGTPKTTTGASVANLNSPNFADGAFGTTWAYNSGQASRTIYITYTVTPYPNTVVGIQSQYKIVTVTTTWTGTPKPIKSTTLQTIVYKQFAGPAVTDFSTDPTMNDSGVLGDESLATVQLTATIDPTWRAATDYAVFNVYAYGGAKIASQTVYQNPDATHINPANAGYDATGGFFWWDWDSTGAGNGTYDFYVTAFSKPGGYAGNTPHLYPTISRPVKPQPPSNVQITGGNAIVNVTWLISSSNDVTSYIVERALSSSGPWTAVQTGIVSTTWTDTTVSNGTTYFYRVRAFSTIQSDPALSTPASVTPAVPPPPDFHPPNAVPSVTATPSGWGVTLNWGTATDSNLDATPSGVVGYQVYECTVAGVLIGVIGSPPSGTLPATVHTWLYTPLSKAMHYFKVIAVDAQGNPPANSTWNTSWSAASIVSANVLGVFRNLTINGNNGQAKWVEIVAPASMPFYGTPTTYFNTAGTGFATPVWSPIAKKGLVTVSLPDFGVSYQVFSSANSSGTSPTAVTWSNWVVNL